MGVERLRQGEARSAARSEGAPPARAMPLTGMLALQRAVGNRVARELVAHPPLGGRAPEHVPAIVHQVLRGAGRPLDPATSARLESRLPSGAAARQAASDPVLVGATDDPAEREADRLAEHVARGDRIPPLRREEGGADLRSIRVHTGDEADASARAIGARAYAAGSDLVFGAGQYDPGSLAGFHLLAHEVAHAVGGGDQVRRQPAVDDPAPATRYETGEVTRSFTEAGHLDPHVLVVAPGMLLVADFGVDWRHVKGSARTDPTLTEWLARFEADDSYRMEVVGYSDSVGTEGGNSWLRQGRAASVEALFGPSARKRITFRGAMALGQYVNTNDTPALRARNRGVVIVFRQEQSFPAEDIEVTPRRTLIVVGSPSKDQTYQLQFATAAECLGRGDAFTTWLVEKTGYELYGVPLDYFDRAAPRGGYGWITQREDLAGWINHQPDSSIGRVVVFSHGVPGLVALRHGWGDKAPDYGLSIADIARINPAKFTDDATLEFNSCNSATDTDGTSIAQSLADRTRHPVTGWTGRTSYAGVNRGTCTVGPSTISSVRELFTEGFSRLRGRTPHKVEIKPH
jgi:hypothetical protein